MMPDNQMKCNIQGRRKSLDGSPLNGIDYIEVVSAPRYKCGNCRPYLVVCFFKPLDSMSPLGKDNVKIEGGIRVKNIGVEWATPADPFNGLPPEAQSRLQSSVAKEDPSRVLVVYPKSDGDFSIYTLRIVNSASTKDEPPEGYDKPLSSITFSFKIDCPAEFDCKPTQECPPETTQEPAIDYLSKDYASFRRLMLDRLATIVPNWKERNPADAGVMTVEMLAYVGDYLSYYQDAAATEAYLGTARSRISVKRHARLLDYFMHSGCNARAWVCIQADDYNNERVVPQKTQLLTGGNDGGLVVDELDLEKEVNAGAKVFEVMYPVILYKANNEISFYTWGDSECCLPKGATNATLLDFAEADKKLNLKIGDVLVFEETASPEGVEEDKNLSHRHAVRLTNVQEDSDDMFTPPVPLLDVTWGDEDALPFPLCLRNDSKPLAVAYGNVVLVDHGQTLAEEQLVDQHGGQNFRPRLTHKTLTFRGPFDALASAFSAFNYNVQDATPDIYLKELTEASKGELGGAVTKNWLPGAWMPKPDLLASNKFDTDFVVEMESDGTAQIRFGDDVHGINPKKTADENPTLLYAFYRVGNGTEGNVGADAIKRLVNPKGTESEKVIVFEDSKDENDCKIRNPLPAYGGIDPETIAEVRQNAPQALELNERAVAESDYAEILKQKCPDVQRAVAETRWTGSWYTVYVTVDRFGGKDLDEDFKNKVRDTLNNYRLVGYDVEVNSPHYVPLKIEITVYVSPNSLRDEVKKALLETFSNSNLPDGRKGFFHPDNFTFGQPVYLSKISATATKVEGVLSLTVDTFERTDKPDGSGLDDGIIKIGPFDIIQLENNPNFLERGRITFKMEGGR